MTVSAPWRSWRVLAVASFGQFAFSGFVLGVAAVAPLIRSAYGLTLSQTGWVVAAASAGPVLVLILWGLLNDRWGERRALTVGLTGCAFALGAAAASTSYLGLCLLLLVASAFGATANVSTGRAVIMSFVPPTRGLALGLRQVAAPIGGALAGVGLPTIAADGTAPAFVTLAVVCAVGAVFAALWLSPHDPAPLAAGAPRMRRNDPRVWRLAVGCGVFLLPQAVFMGFTAVLLTGERGLSPVAAGAVLGLLQLVGSGLRVLVGYGSERWSRPVPTLRRMCFAVAVGTLTTAVALRAPVGVTVAVLVVAGALAMSWNSIPVGLMAEYGGDRGSGYALGIHATMLFVGSTVAVPLFAALVEATSWALAFGVLTAAPAAAWLILRPL